MGDLSAGTLGGGAGGWDSGRLLGDAVFTLGGVAGCCLGDECLRGGVGWYLGVESSRGTLGGGVGLLAAETFAGLLAGTFGFSRD